MTQHGDGGGDDGGDGGDDDDGALGPQVIHHVHQWAEKRRVQ